MWESGRSDDAEASGLGWPALYAQFKRMEMRGEVRRGYFVQGLPGVQFALPEAVERLRQWTRPDEPGAEDLVILNAGDPANLFGPALAGSEAHEHDPARFTRIPANYVVLLRGRAVLLLETAAQKLTVLAHPQDPVQYDLPPDTLKRALRVAARHIGEQMPGLTLSECNGESILDSPVAPVLEEIGFRRDGLVYVWE